MKDLSKELQQQVLSAYDQATALEIQGGASKRFLGNKVDAQTLSTKEHQGIVSYDPVELVVTARAGTPLSELEQALAEHHQHLPFEPPRYGDNATLGGTIACGLSGPARPYRGAARDYVLGAKIINGKGQVLQFGGQVMKNVAGYDCSRLMAGAMGTLGILLDISLKVLPKPAKEITLSQELGQAEALSTMNSLSSKPLPLTAACYDGQQMHLRLSGAESAIKSARDTIGGESNTNDTFWFDIKEHQHAFFQSNLPLWRLSIPANAPELELPGTCFIDWGGAQRWLLSDENESTIREKANKLGGHASLYRTSDTGETFQRPSNEVFHLHRQLKKAFDPAGILNPGRLYPDL